jgi:hypothetical protein
MIGFPFVATLRAVYGFTPPDGGTTPTDVFAAGEQVILHQDSTGTWTPIDSLLLNECVITSMWGSSANDVWFGGYTADVDDIVYHWDGSQLTQITSFPGPVAAAPAAISGVAGGDFWLVGGGSGLQNMHMHYSGAP